MPCYDLSRSDLEVYRPAREEPADFDAFWSETLDEARALPLDLQRSPVDAGYRELVTEDISFAGFGGHRIKGWFVTPAHRTGPLPVVVTYLG